MASVVAWIVWAVFDIAGAGAALLLLSAMFSGDGS